MREKLKILKFVCNFVGLVALLCYLVFALLGITNSYLVARIITASIALLAYSISCCADIIDHSKIGYSLSMMAFSLIDIIASALQLN